MYILKGSKMYIFRLTFIHIDEKIKEAFRNNYCIHIISDKSQRMLDLVLECEQRQFFLPESVLTYIIDLNENKAVTKTLANKCATYLKANDRFDMTKDEIAGFLLQCKGN